MSQTLVRPKVVDVRVDVHDLRGAQALPVPRPVLHDPSGQRGRRLRALSRGVIGLLVAWLAGLSLAGLGLVPAAMIPLGSLVAAPAPKALMTMTSGPDTAAAGRPGSSSSIGVAVQIAAERLAPPAGPPFAGDVMPGGRQHWRRASGSGAGVTPLSGDDTPTVSVTQPRGGAGAPAPSAGVPSPQTPSAAADSPASAPVGGGSPAASAPAQQPSGATPATDAATAAPGNSESAPSSAGGPAPGASGTAPGRTADTPAAENASNGGNGGASNGANANGSNGANGGANNGANANAGNGANANAKNGNGQARGRTGAAS